MHLSFRGPAAALALGVAAFAWPALSRAADPAPAAAPPAAPTAFLMWQMPGSGVDFPVYVYRDKKQTDYLYGTTQQAFLGGYDTTTAGKWTLYYRKGRKWYGCTLALAAGAIDNAGTTCPGAVINPPVATSNVYTVALGASTWPSSAKPPAAPVNTDYGKRTIVFVNNTQYASIRIGMHCTVSANPSNPACVNKPNLLEVAKGQRVAFQVDDKTKEGKAYPAGLISYAFSMTAYQNGSDWVESGGYSENQPYATKIELTSMPVRTDSAGRQFPAGATNFDVSAVDGYNVGVKAYPAVPTICTYTVPPENSNVLGAGLYSETAPLASISATAQTCRVSSQLPARARGRRSAAWNLLVTDGDGDFQGCMSPCTYASSKFGATSPAAAMYCCSGRFGTAAGCDQPAGKPGANTSTYVQNLGGATKNVYRFAYDDAIGDFACPARTGFVVEFTTP